MTPRRRPTHGRAQTTHTLGMSDVGTFPSTHARFVYVGDNPMKDFVAPRRLGWTTVRVRRSKGQYASLEASPPYAAHAELDDLGRLDEVLSDLALTV